MTEEASSRIAFLALGTRGDVQPLAQLAAELHRRERSLQCHLITHATHQVSLTERLDAHVLLHV